MSIRGISMPLAALLVTGLALAGCGSHPGGAVTAPRDEAALAKSRTTLPEFDPGGFVASVTNPYFPLVPGTTFTYIAHTSAGTESTVTEVTHDTRTILGVVTTVVHDRVFLDGTLAEDTFDWYAQDAAGNVWYFGEATQEFTGEGVSTEGSWEAGVDGAAAGVIMLAAPEVGDTYPQEQAPGVAEDMAKVLALDATVTVPYGTFDHVLQTLEWSNLEHGHGSREVKSYASGVGLILESSRNGRQRTELVSVTHE